MASKGNSTAPTATPEFWCKICKLPFKTDGAFKIHKVNSDRHICCDVCGADFNSEEGKKRHRAAHHAEEQDLTCKFCGLNYPRVGSLIHHYEESQCKQVSSEVFKQAIKDIMVRETAKRKAHNFKDIRRSGDFSAQGQEPLPPLRNVSNFPPAPDNNGGITNGGWPTSGQYNGVQGGGAQDGDWQSTGTGTQGIGRRQGGRSNAAPHDGGWTTAASGQGIGIQQGGWSSAAPQNADGPSTPRYQMETPLINVVPDTPIREDEDLICFDPSSAILNSPWSVSASDALKNAQKYSRAKDFPALGGNAVNRGYAQGAGPSVCQNGAQGFAQGANQGIPQTPDNRGPPHTWRNGGTTTANAAPSGQGGDQGIAQGSDNRGPPHTWGKTNTLAVPATANSTSRGPPNNTAVKQAAPPTVNNANGYNNADGWDKSANGNKQGEAHSASGSSRHPSANENAHSVAQTNTLPLGGGQSRNPWGQKNLFPNAPPAAAPPVDLLSSLSISTTTSAPPKAYKMFDPSNPSFKASKFYVEILKKWKCPHLGCNGSFKTQNSFVAHLRSPAHSDEKFQCLKCLRYYDSLTALTQHSESQGVRCNVRETDDFDSVVRTITADTTTTNGRMADDTIRYEINPDAELTKLKMAENYRAAEKSHHEARAHYWDNKKVAW